jgi:hypothetical protein
VSGHALDQADPNNPIAYYALSSALNSRDWLTRFIGNDACRMSQAPASSA